MKKLLFTFLLSLSFTLVGAQEVTLTKGVVMDTLSISDTIPETYSLYLPSNFTAERPWPVLFVFDDEGRGRNVAQLFRQVAEDQGYVVAASNEILPDTALIANVRIATRLIDRVLNFFPVQKNQIYAAGLNNGARVASVLPAIYPDVDGVLAVGDVWVNSDFIRKNADFSFFGLAAYKDYRSNILEETAGLLSNAKLSATTLQFEGDKDWPGVEIISYAIGKFTLEAMQEGKREADAVLVENLYQADLETADRLRRSMQHYKAHQLLEQMEDKYAAYNKRRDLRSRQKAIRAERVYKNQRRDYNRAATRENELRDRFIYFFNEDVYAANFENLGWWSHQIEELEALQEKGNMAEREMAHRMEGLLTALANNSFEALQEANASIDPLIFTAILQTIFEKENPQGYKNIISLSAQDGDYYTALLYLEDLLKTGFDDMDALYNIPGTLDLKLSPEFNELVKKYLGSSRYYDN